MTSCICVAVRVRPFNEREVKYESELAVAMEGCTTSVKPLVGGRVSSSGGKPRDFQFDHCFWSFDQKDKNKFASQENIYETVVSPMLDDALDGYNGCIVAFGQTGSGKSHTISGCSSDPGIIPRLCKDLFHRVETKEDGLIMKVECCYLEIYNEGVKDLLNPSTVEKVLKVRSHPKFGIYVEHLTKLMVTTETEIVKLIEEGNTIRAVGVSNLRGRCSKSHAMLMLSIRTQHPDGAETFSALNIVDLAGSEHTASTKAITGVSITEPPTLHKSLSNLRTCVTRLAEAADRKAMPKNIPYKDSQLTWLLSDCLGGNCKTTLVATISPAHIYHEEILSTLTFAESMRKVVQTPIENEDPQQRLIRELRGEIEAIKTQLKGFEEGSVAPTEGKTKAELLQQLVDSTEMFQEVTESEEEKVQKQKALSQKRQRVLAKMKAENKIPTDSTIPQLHVLNDDIKRFPDISAMYYVPDGETKLGRGSDCGIRLVVSAKSGPDGSEIFPLHCTFTCDALRRRVTITPFSDPAAADDPETFLNGELLKEPRALRHMDRLVIGPLAFRHAQPPAWGENNETCEFDREAKNPVHTQLLEVHDRCQVQLSEFTVLGNTLGFDEAEKIRPDVNQVRSTLNAVETQLIIDYPLPDKDRPSIAEHKKKFDFKYAMKEKQQVKFLEEVDANDKTISEMMSELGLEEVAPKKPPPKPTVGKKAPPKKASAKAPPPPKPDDDDDDIDIDAMLNDLDDAPPKAAPPPKSAAKKAPSAKGAAKAPPPKKQVITVTDSEDDDDILKMMDELDDGPKAKPAAKPAAKPTPKKIALDETAGVMAMMQELGVDVEIEEEPAAESQVFLGAKPSIAGGSFAAQQQHHFDPDDLISTSLNPNAAGVSLKAMLAKELVTYEEEVKSSQKWKPDGPQAGWPPGDRKEYLENALKTIPYTQLTAKDVDKQGSMYKYRFKKSVFHKGGFCPIHAVLRGHFLYYFEPNPAKSASSLGSVYLYGAQIQVSVAAFEGKTYVAVIVPAVPRKSSKSSKERTEDNNLILAWDTQQEMEEWLNLLLRATRPPVNPSLAPYFGDEVQLPSLPGAGGTKRLERRQATLLNDENVKLTVADVRTMREFAALEKERMAHPVQLVPANMKLRPITIDIDLQAEEDARAHAEQDTAAPNGDKAFEMPPTPEPPVKPNEYPYKIPLRSVPNNQYLKCYFRTCLHPEREDQIKRKNRMWLVDHFSATLELIDLNQKIALVYQAKQLTAVERSIDAPTRAKLTFFHYGFHAYEEYFVSFGDREKFYETVCCIRPCLRVYCPPLVLGSEEDGDDSTTPVDGVGAEAIEIASVGPATKQMKLSGACLLRVSRDLFEPLSIWCGTVNLDGFPLQNNDAFRKFVTPNRYDLYVISVQEASYRRTQNQFLECFTKFLGQDYLPVASVELYDILLIVMARRRNYVKISNVESSTCPSSIESLSGERGGVGVCFRYLRTSLCFVAVQLPGQSQRQDLRRYILNEVLSGLLLGVKNTDVSAQFDHVILLGDLNFPMEASATMAALQTAVRGSPTSFKKFVSQYDTLTMDREKKRILHNFSEPVITFPPTNYVEIGTDKYNTTKQAAPSYSGRILIKSHKDGHAECARYTSHPQLCVCEHMPVSSVFVVQCVRPSACCFMSHEEAPNGIIVTFETVRVHRSLEAQEPCLTIHSDLFEGVTLERKCDTITSADGTSEYHWTEGEAMRVHLRCPIPEVLNQHAVLFIVFDRSEELEPKRHKATAYIPLQADHFQPDKAGKMQELSGMMQKGCRNVTGVTVKYRWSPMEAAAAAASAS